MSRAHSYVPMLDREQVTIDYLIRGMDSKAIQCHLVTIDSSTVSGTERAIEEYLAIKNCICPSCKVIGENIAGNQLTQIKATLVTLSDFGLFRIIASDDSRKICY